MSSTDSEDEVPLSKRFKIGFKVAPKTTEAATAVAEKPLARPTEVRPGETGASAVVQHAPGTSKGLSAQLNNNIVPAGFSREKFSSGKGSGSSTSASDRPSANGAAAVKVQTSQVAKAPRPASKPGSSLGPRADTSAAKQGTTKASKGGPSNATTAGASNASKAGPSKPVSTTTTVASERPKPAAIPNGSHADAPAATAPETDSDSEDDLPLNLRFKAQTPKPKPKPEFEPWPEPKSTKRGPRPMSKAERTEHKAKKRQLAATSEGSEERASKRRKSEAKGGAEKKWNTLRHCGVLFPPEYTPHGVKMLYDGKPVTLKPEEEEVATMYATMLETDYMKKEQFNKNFWSAFKEVLGKGHVIKSLEKCDFRPIHEHIMAEREAKKALPKEEKQRLKAEKEAAEAKYKVAEVDGRKEGVGNFRVEPPGLFRGRGEHPKMGQLKRRIYPHDITINIGKGEPIPEHPYPGQEWKEVRHDQTVTWLAFWKDAISDKDYKYVWLAANSVFKSDSDLAKYQKARKLKGYVADIRAMYKQDWGSSNIFKRQMGVALYFIDSLALRAGHEKDEDEADTVGCCTLKVENVACLTDPPNNINFDFLGKDSIRYENKVQVDERVWKLVKQFCQKDQHGKAKTPDSQLFDTLNANDLNTALKNLMEGLSVKVFRTYNASITLDKMLHKETVSETIESKKADYDLANKEVAILCNHQRAVPKGHSDAMQKLADKLQTAQSELDALIMELKVVQGSIKASELPDPSKKLPNEETLNNRIQKKKAQLHKVQVQQRSRDDLKTVALGTSKINYLDPRITVAWCKRSEVPIEKIFNKSLLSKFHWAMDADPDFKF